MTEKFRRNLELFLVIKTTINNPKFVLNIFAC